MIVEAGARPGPGDLPIPVDVPYGSRARLILIYLQTEALRTGCREVKFGRSLREWLRRPGISQGGKSIKEVREQAERISRCRLTATRMRVWRTRYTAVFRVGDALKRTVFPALTFTFSPVRGLSACLALVFRTVKVPKPGSVNFPAFFISLTIAEIRSVAA